MLEIALAGMRCVGFGFEGATSGTVSAHGRLDVLGLQHRSSQARGGAKLAVDLVLEVKTPFTLAGPRAVDGWNPYRYRPREPACLSQLTRCHRGGQHSRGLAVGQCKRRKQLVAMDVVFCMFSALIEGIVESHTAVRRIVSFGQVQINVQLKLWVTKECYRRMAGGLAGVFVWVGWRGRAVSRWALAAGNAMLMMRPGRGNHHSPL